MTILVIVICSIVAIVGIMPISRCPIYVMGGFCLVN